MPSSSKSSKRRKAAKRKKKKASITTIQSPPANSQQGDNDQKTLDEKVNVSGESGDVSSPTSQDPLHQLMEEKRDCSSFPTSDNKPMLGGGSENGGGSIGEDLSHKTEEVIEVMEVVRELKTEMDSENGAACIEYIESAKESGNGGSVDSSSDSSSDAETQVNEKKQNLIMEEGKKLKEEVEDKNSGPGIVPAVDSGEQVVPLIEETTSTQVVEEDIPVEKVENLGSSSLPSKEIDENTLPSSVPPSVDTSNGGGQRKESEVPENSQNQEQVSSVPPTVQPTSWKCCCGLFDVLTGSNR